MHGSPQWPKGVRAGARWCENTYARHTGEMTIHLCVHTHRGAAYWAKWAEWASKHPEAGGRFREAIMGAAPKMGGCELAQ